VRIAVVEDDTHVGQLVCLWLEEAGHHYQLFTTGGEFQKSVIHESYDLAVLDWMLPDTTGDRLLAWLRERMDWRLPVVFVTARDSEEDIVRGLTLGADDYIAKPVRRNELLARIGAVTRRSQVTPRENEVLDVAPFSIDTGARAVRRGNQAIELTQKEYELALFLFRHPGRLLSRSHILQSVWGHHADISTRTVDTHVSRLRAKLGLGPESGWNLISVYNHGYRLEQADGNQLAG
jgi:DNA-binding response OmpR family regulator